MKNKQIKFATIVLLTANFLLQSTQLFCQSVGVNGTGGTPNVSALLDIDATGMSPKGLLIPRIALTSATDAATIATPATSLLVYNTGAGALSPAGYYYNQGTSGSPNWVPFLTNNVNAPAAWSLTGNTGTTGGPNFIGTTDNISLRFRTNNTQKMIIDSLGNVGIGITAPLYKLDVRNGFPRFSNNTTSIPASSNGLVIGWNRSGGNADVNFYNAYDNAVTSYIFSQKTGVATYTDLMTMLGNGNIGIGTTNPSARLQVGAAASDGRANGIQLGDVATYKYTLYQQSSSSGAISNAVVLDANGDADYRQGLGTNNGSGRIVFMTGQGSGIGGTGASTEKMRIEPNGNLGIGITSPLSKLHVAETSISDPRGITNDQYSADATACRLNFRKSRSAVIGSHTILQSGDYINNIVSLGSDGVNFIPACYIRTAVDGTPGVNDMPGRIEFLTTADGASAPTERMRIDNVGNVSIGGVAPAYKLDVCGDIRATGSVYYGGTCGTANGTLYTKPDFVFTPDYTFYTPDEVEKFIHQKGHLPWLTSANKDEKENKGAVNMTRMSFETLEAVENMQLQIIEQQKIIEELKTRMKVLEAK